MLSSGLFERWQASGIETCRFVASDAVSEMNIEEHFTIPAPIERVWAFIRDPDRVAPCVPGCERVETISATSYHSTMAVALGPIKARFVVVVEIADEKPPTRLTCVTKGEEGGRASIISATSEILLAEREKPKCDALPRYRSSAAWANSDSAS